MSILDEKIKKYSDIISNAEKTLNGQNNENIRKQALELLTLVNSDNFFAQYISTTPLLNKIVLLSAFSGDRSLEFLFSVILQQISINSLESKSLTSAKMSLTSLAVLAQSEDVEQIHNSLSSLKTMIISPNFPSEAASVLVNLPFWNYMIRWVRNIDQDLDSLRIKADAFALLCALISNEETWKVMYSLKEIKTILKYVKSCASKKRMKKIKKANTSIVPSLLSSSIHSVIDTLSEGHSSKHSSSSSSSSSFSSSSSSSSTSSSLSSSSSSSSLSSLIDENEDNQYNYICKEAELLDNIEEAACFIIIQKGLIKVGKKDENSSDEEDEEEDEEESSADESEEKVGKKRIKFKYSGHTLKKLSLKKIKITSRAAQSFEVKGNTITRTSYNQGSSESYIITFSLEKPGVYQWYGSYFGISMDSIPAWSSGNLLGMSFKGYSISSKGSLFLNNHERTQIGISALHPGDELVVELVKKKKPYKLFFFVNGVQCKMYFDNADGFLQFSMSSYGNLDSWTMLFIRKVSNPASSLKVPGLTIYS